MKVEEIVFRRHYDGLMHYIDMSDIPLKFLTHEFKIDIEKTPAFYGSEHGNDDYTDLRIIKIREQTEEEKAEFKKKWKELEEKSRKERYEEYLRLKKEFDEETEALPNNNGST